MIRIQEDYELYFMLLGVPLAFLTIFLFEKVSNRLIMTVVGLVYFYGAFGGFGEDIQNRLRVHILFFIVAGVFVWIFLLVEKIKAKRKAKQASSIEE